MKVWSLEAIERRGCSHSVGTHVVKYQPVTDLQVWQIALLYNAVQSITGGAPDTAWVHRFVWLWLLSMTWDHRNTLEPLSFLLTEILI